MLVMFFIPLKIRGIKGVMNVSLLHFVQGQALGGAIAVFSFVTPLTPLTLRGGMLRSNLFLESEVGTDPFLHDCKWEGAGVIPAPSLIGADHPAAGSAVHREALYLWWQHFETQLQGRHGEHTWAE
jgi:hypothetical protein